MFTTTISQIHVRYYEFMTLSRYRNLLSNSLKWKYFGLGMAKINHHSTKIVYTVWFLYSKYCKNENISKENLGIEI